MLIGSRDAVAQSEPAVGAWDSSPRVSVLRYCRALPYKCLQVNQVCDLRHPCVTSARGNDHMMS